VLGRIDLGHPHAHLASGAPRAQRVAVADADDTADGRRGQRGRLVTGMDGGGEDGKRQREKSHSVIFAVATSSTM